jgi:hypothetical protein
MIIITITQLWPHEIQDAWYSSRILLSRMGSQQFFLVADSEGRRGQALSLILSASLLTCILVKVSIFLYIRDRIRYVLLFRKNQVVVDVPCSVTEVTGQVLLIHGGHGKQGLFVWWSSWQVLRVSDFTVNTWKNRMSKMWAYPAIHPCLIGGLRATRVTSFTAISGYLPCCTVHLVE